MPVRGQVPTYLLELRNDVQTSATEYEFDIYLLRTGSVPFEYAIGQYGILVNPDIKNGGSLLASIVSGSIDPVLAATNQVPATINFFEAGNAIRISPPPPPGAGNGALISNVPPGTRICRVRLSNTTAFGQFQPNLTWTTTAVYPTQVYAYVGSTNTSITNYSNHTTSSLSNPVLNVVTAIEDNLADDNLKVYPNPFKDRINIDYVLLQNSHVRLSILSLNGKLIDQLADEDQQAGRYSLSWESYDQPEGVYLIRLETDMSRKISRATLIR